MDLGQGMLPNCSWLALTLPSPAQPCFFHPSQTGVWSCQPRPCEYLERRNVTNVTSHRGSLAVGCRGISIVKEIGRSREKNEEIQKYFHGKTKVGESPPASPGCFIAPKCSDRAGNDLTQGMRPHRDPITPQTQRILPSLPDPARFPHPSPALVLPLSPSSWSWDDSGLSPCALSWFHSLGTAGDGPEAGIIPRISQNTAPHVSIQTSHPILAALCVKNWN